MALLFGTDGVRARVNTGPMTAEAVVRLALAAGRWSVDNSKRQGSAYPTVVLGKDTRLSGYMVEAALVAGFTSIGLDCRLLGPIPTPGVAHLTRSLRAELGVMISASHNPHYDNGIKLFGPDGFKLNDSILDEISALAVGSIELADAPKMGRARRMLDSVGRYVEFAKGTLSRQVRLDGLKIVVDCANGAAYRTAPDTLYELGAEVVPLGVTPNGFNINEECGAVHPQTMASAVVVHGADAGISLDGDADRIIMADETGAIVDGDQIVGCLALAKKRNGTLHGNAVVGTVMSNSGLESRLAQAGITFHRTAVGDRYILEKLFANGYSLGGEPSGHVLLPTLARAGDGLLAGLQMLVLLKESGDVASNLFHSFAPSPQRLENLFGIDPVILKDVNLQKDIKAIEAELNGRGRVLVRPSGTENLIRVMVEAETDKLLTSTMDALILRIKKSEL
jgi:phosphoglucosamine mutase